MTWAGVAIGAGTAVSGMIGSSSAKKAAKEQAAASRAATALQARMYDTTRADMAGYRDIGQTGLEQIKHNLSDLTGTFSMDKFEKDPGYDFRQQEGQKALERSASARGGLLGGGAAKALARYGQDYASNEYSNAYNRFNQDRDQRYGKLMDIVGTGQNAAANTGAAGQNYANSAAQNMIGSGNAQAASHIASGNAWGNALQQGIGAYAMGGGFGGSGGDVSKLTPPSNLPGLDYSNPTFGIKSSDRRLKLNIERVSTSLYKDVPTYRFEYKDRAHGVGPQIGVMAQDLLELDSNHPAVGERDGFYTVDYSKLEAN